MALIEVPAQLTLPGLFRAVEQLSLDDLDSLMAHARTVRLRFTDEEKLMAAIRQTLREDEVNRLEALSQKLEDENITEDERSELLELVEKSEELDVVRAEAILALSQKRGTTVNQVLASLN